MKYQLELKPRVIKDLNKIPKTEVRRIVEKIRILEDNLRGNVKQLTNHTLEYRLRVGDWRVLFEIEDEKIVIYRIRHRKHAYK